MEMQRHDYAGETPAERWVHWPVHWSGVWVGTLTALAVALIIGLIGIAVGAQVVTRDPEAAWVDLKKIGIWTVVFSVFGSFLAFVAGGWVAGKIAGIRRSEPAMLHGAIVWALAVPFLVAFAAAGAGNYYGGWYGGLGPVEQVKLDPNATKEAVNKAYERAAAITRNAALGAVTALLLGLVGGVIGGWMASGEPMNFSHYRTRHLAATHQSDYAAAART
jgi:hypothetical protein